jgi:two-component system sensor histidine kinase BaeS
VRRRLLLAILGTVALSVVLAGVGTYLLVRREAVRTTEANLRAEAEGLVGLFDRVGAGQAGGFRQQRLVAGLRLEGFSVLVKGPAGVVRGELPAGVDSADVNADTMVAGTTVSGRSGDLTWAAASIEGFRGSVVTLVITRAPESPRLPVGWFLLGGGLALAVGAAVAAGLSQALSRPVLEASAATVRIAGGDLATHLPEPPPGDRDELAELSRSINAMAAALAASRGQERQFVLSVSHDLRTPLTSIRGYADAIADGTTTDAPGAARIISAEAQRLGRLVGDLLDLARLDNRTFSLELRPVPVAEVVTDTAEGFRPTAEDAGVALAVVEPATAAVLVVDPDRLAQAVANLVENALRFATTTVEVATHLQPDGSVAITVADDGPGIPPADLPHVFERLYTADRRPRRPGGGTGLGLAIVRELVGGMGGHVWAESPARPDGTGARLVIALPPPAHGPAPTSPAAPTPPT